jgi:hypothetical protein
MSEDEKRRFAQRPFHATQRPPTLAETGEYARYWHSELKTPEDLQQWVGEHFVSNYVYYVNNLGWTKPPDWKEGEPVVAEACPTRPFPHHRYDRRNRDEVARLYRLQKGE